MYQFSWTRPADTLSIESAGGGPQTSIISLQGTTTRVITVLLRSLCHAGMSGWSYAGKTGDNHKRLPLTGCRLNVVSAELGR